MSRRQLRSRPAGEHWAADRDNRLNQQFAERPVAPQPGERFLDVGCGNGAITIAVSRAVGTGGHVVGHRCPRRVLLADPKEVTTLLESAGFVDVDLQKVTTPMWMGATIDDATGFVRTAEFAMTLFNGIELQGNAWLVTARRP